MGIQEGYGVGLSRVEKSRAKKSSVGQSRMKNIEELEEGMRKAKEGGTDLRRVGCCKQTKKKGEKNRIENGKVERTRAEKRVEKSRVEKNLNMIHNIYRALN